MRREEKFGRERVPGTVEHGGRLGIVDGDQISDASEHRADHGSQTDPVQVVDGLGKELERVTLVAAACCEVAGDRPDGRSVSAGKFDRLAHEGEGAFGFGIAQGKTCHGEYTLGIACVAEAAREGDRFFGFGEYPDRVAYHCAAAGGSS